MARSTTIAAKDVRGALLKRGLFFDRDAETELFNGITTNYDCQVRS